MNDGKKQEERLARAAESLRQFRENMQLIKIISGKKSKAKTSFQPKNWSRASEHEILLGSRTLVKGHR
jgi:hypothetical protein